MNKNFPVNIQRDVEDPNDWKSRTSKVSRLVRASQETFSGSDKSYYANNSVNLFVRQTAKEERFVIMFEVQDNYSHVSFPTDSA